MIFLKQVSKHHLMGAESVYIHVYDHIPYMGSVAERSKALVLGTSLFGGVGSNPTPIITILCFWFSQTVLANMFLLFVRAGAHIFSELAQRKRVRLIT